MYRWRVQPSNFWLHPRKPLGGSILTLEKTLNGPHIWRALCSEHPLTELKSKYFELLSKEEKIRFAAFKIPQAQLQFLLARLILRHGISHYAGDLNPSELEFYENSYRRPFCDAPPVTRDIYFNISHAQQNVLVVFSKQKALGIDVEYTKAPIDALDLAQTAFSAAENTWLHAVENPADRTRCFFTIWTLKEAYIKARGMGLYLPTQAFSILPTPNGEFRLHCTPELDPAPKRWRFFTRNLGDYCLSGAQIAEQSIDAWPMSDVVALPVFQRSS